LAAWAQTGFGVITVESGSFETRGPGTAGHSIAYKLYIPAGAGEDHPVPAVLVMHGYQNDKETSAAYGIELARRGIAALSIDLYGHGGTTAGMRFRGAGKRRLAGPEGQSEAEPETLSGPERFLMMMTFSVLDFFRPGISEGIRDSSMGGRDAYRFLASLPLVDPGRIGITGHSMGTWAAWTVGASFPSHRAIVLQCGELLAPAYYDAEGIKFNNVMLIQARYDEFSYFRDYRPNVTGLEKTPLRYRDFMGQETPVEWNRTYGSFTGGSARRMELIQNNHRLTTHDGRAVSAALAWFTTALEAETSLADFDHVYMIKEVLGLLAMLAALGSLLPLFLLLTRFRFFSPLIGGGPVSGKFLPARSRRKAALTAILLSGLSFPFLGQLGHGLLPVPENIFRMTMGNGFITWLSFLTAVTFFMLRFWYRRGEGKRMGINLSDLGLADRGKPEKLNWPVIGKSALAALILGGAMYGLVCLTGALFRMDLRFIWPFFKPFSAERFGQFFVYLPFYAAFFTVNAGVKLYGQLRLPEKKSPAVTQLVWWGYSLLIMLGGVFLMVLIEYIPFFMGLGPGADLIFSPLFGGPMMSVMILLIPQFAVFFFLSTYLYRRSGWIYPGSFLVAVLASWVVAGGSAVF
jgi:dienelactone hydrolase